MADRTDTRPIYDFTFPACGIAAQWRPLTAGQEINVLTTFRREEEVPLHGAMLTVARVVKFGAADRMTLADYQNLEAVDIEALQDEILLRESERRASLRKVDPTKGTPTQLAIEAVKDAVKAYAHAIGMLNKAAEYMQAADRSGGATPLPR